MPRINLRSRSAYSASQIQLRPSARNTSISTAPFLRKNRGNILPYDVASKLCRNVLDMDLRRHCATAVPAASITARSTHFQPGTRCSIHFRIEPAVPLSTRSTGRS